MNSKILIIEDNEDIQSLLFDVLSTNYLIFKAVDGVTGINEYKNCNPDLIILDLMLPQINGESVLKFIRQQSQVPIIVLTAIQSKTKTVDLLNEGANDYLTKPFDVDELQARIQVQLRNQSTIKPDNLLQYEDVSLNNQTHEVIAATKELILSKKEFRLLQILLAHPHQVFEKSQLFQVVWHEEYLDGSDNTLNVHISNLRHKLLNATGKDYLVSIWGIGIRFV
ncbi:response regulator transcription factor [Companilactobacillus kimchiensis]|uniref:Response regulator receiver domain protein n=1 Tax=Companilactobacillus kimchiensis TaxID=993692 RepID=A0A0R2LFI1_9LACO|nr:response regulator transcription factor [Companilactobacillus kimchiensis]KRO00574.1 response regulator receiver domain protein [Companilactobacillus kimchiensis]